MEERCNPWRNKDVYFYNERPKNYSAIFHEVAKEAEAEFIDTYATVEKVKDWNVYTDDGLHPNSEGHKLIFEALKEHF
ncbi:hypothetical protein COV04_03045 [Candidatus Uhrbacteria bacterium CG10_big_fil_rev_8_21_14_0_10_48_11]|uniref:SGNH hydrolase-type esterase domain-containing protein n=1 Tax=Candidatus Uhrbacteria bacterium CG10_big_fil_rev_8_21_14_0_10_48_11 TaxID=1975037 RepID=A0A2M8LEU7_9BACT|nr:MAG: hypothetical protein COV04_03045 [Candidatus Uhrbacteria bacterium CG10_big_fil_rev_8_21_14_0_10_48_11]